MTETTPEQKARDMLDRMGVANAQRWSAGELVELANLIADHQRLVAQSLSTRCDVGGTPEPTFVDAYLLTMTFVEPRQAVTFSPSGKAVLVITYDGRFVLGDGATVDEAAQAVVEVAARVYGNKLSAAYARIALLEQQLATLPPPSP